MLRFIFYIIFIFCNSLYFKAQYLSVSSGSSMDVYLADKNNLKYNQKAERYGWLFEGGRLAYHQELPYKRKDQLTFFVNTFPIYQGLNPPKNGLDDFFPNVKKMWSNSRESEPSIGLSYDFFLFNYKKLTLYAGTGIGFRFSPYGIESTVNYYSNLINGDRIDINYSFIQLSKIAVFTPFDLRYIYMINEGFFLFFQTTYQLGWKKWINVDISYEIYDAATDHLELINNKMYHNGSQFLIQFGMTFNLKKKSISENT